MAVHSKSLHQIHVTCFDPLAFDICLLYVKVIKKSGGLYAIEYLILTNFYVICDLQLNRHTKNGFVHVTKKDAYKAMFTLLDTFCTGTKTIRVGLVFTHKNGDFVAISVTERCCFAPIFQVESHINRMGVQTIPESFS